MNKFLIHIPKKLHNDELELIWDSMNCLRTQHMNAASTVLRKNFKCFNNSNKFNQNRWFLQRTVDCPERILTRE